MGRRPDSGREDKLNRGAWTSLEDKMLKDYVTAHGDGRWSSVAREAGLSRCAKSCRLRWLNYLRPDIKRGNITEDEEDLIIRLHKLLGNRWSLIAGRLPGRTDNEIKNYWHTNLAKKEKKTGWSNDTTARNQEQKKTRRSEMEQPSGLLQDDKTELHCSSGVVSRVPIRLEDRESQLEHSYRSGDDRSTTLSPMEGLARFETDLLLQDVDLSGINFDFLNFSGMCDHEASLIGSASNGCIDHEAGEDHFLVESPQWLHAGGTLEGLYSSDFAHGEDLFL